MWCAVLGILTSMFVCLVYIIYYMQCWDVQENMFNVQDVKANKNGRNDIVVMGHKDSVIISFHFYVSFLIGHFWGNRLKMLV